MINVRHSCSRWGDWVSRRLRAGTRGSKLARRQTAMIIKIILNKYPDLEIEEVVISTRGDMDMKPIKDLVTRGEMGAFTKELEKALLNEEIDFAVHSLKDLPVEQPTGLVLGAVPERGIPYDAVVSRDGRPLRDLIPGSLLGTSSLRRASQLRHHYPHLKVVDIRGNLDTRLRKLESGDMDAVVLAAAGLARLGYRENEHFFLIPPRVCLPAPGQGALALEIRESDDFLQDICSAALNDYRARQEVYAERALLQILGGGCQVPLGAFAQVEGDSLRLQGAVAAPDGSQVIRAETTCPAKNPLQASQFVAAELTEKGAKELIVCE